MFLIIVCLWFPAAISEVQVVDVRKIEAGPSGKSIQQPRPSKAKSALPNDQRCWEYTWMGKHTTHDILAGLSHSESEMAKKICKDKEKEGIPCIQPLVFTVGGSGQPSTDSIQKACTNSSAFHQNVTCTPYCQMEDTCVKMTYFSSGSDHAFYSSHFCGRGVEVTNDGTSILSKCYKQYNKDDKGYDVEACFCSHNQCNTSSLLTSQKIFLFISLFNIFHIGQLFN